MTLSCMNEEFVTDAFWAQFHQAWVSNLNDPSIPWVTSSSVRPHLSDLLSFLLDVPAEETWLSKRSVFTGAACGLSSR